MVHVMFYFASRAIKHSCQKKMIIMNGENLLVSENCNYFYCKNGLVGFMTICFTDIR